MAFSGASAKNDKLKSATVVVLIHVVVGYVILNAFDIRPGDVITSSLSRLNMVDFSIPPVVADEQSKQATPEGAASAANLKKTSAPREAPKRIIEIPQPKPLLAAPTAGKGSEKDAGATITPGPGTGVGGVGSGFGSGNNGNGTGGGSMTSRAKLVGGMITNADYPKSATATRQGGSVTAHFTFGVDGHAKKCRVVKSSGNSDIDATTCRLTEQRFRYEPARNKLRHPISDVTGWQQTWWLERGNLKFIRPGDDLPKLPPVYVPPPADR